MSDNGDYRTLVEKIGINPHRMLGVSVANNGWKFKKNMSDNFGRDENRPKPKELNRDRN